eukprot:Selendium_serpulae@DN3479_c0_g1_i2.p2
MEHVDYFTRFVDYEQDFDVNDRMFCCSTFLPASSSIFPTMQSVIDSQREELTPTQQGFVERDGVVFYHGRVWAPPTIRKSIMDAAHSMAPFRHQGVKKTVKTIQRVFNWSRCHRDVADHLRACLSCQRIRVGRETIQGLMRPHPMRGPLHTVYLSLLGK